MNEIMNGGDNVRHLRNETFPALSVNKDVMVTSNCSHYGR